MYKNVDFTDNIFKIKLIEHPCVISNGIPQLRSKFTQTLNVDDPAS
jgi:hypothetical protein